MLPFKKKVFFLFLLGLLVTIYQIWRSMEIPTNAINENQREWRTMLEPYSHLKTQGNAPAVIDF
jgi:hypothetical protein